MLRDMALARAFDERMYPRPAAGQDQLLHEVHRRGGDLDRRGAWRSPATTWCFPTYRQQGILIARGYPLVEMMNQIYSNSADKLKGRQLPIMYSAEATRLLLDLAATSPRNIPQAVGWAMASAAKGDSRIAATWVRRGARPPRATSTRR